MPPLVRRVIMYVNPARAGMIPPTAARSSPPYSKPRACGDDPSEKAERMVVEE